MEQVSPTRMNLLLRKGQLRLARQGRDLLEQKRQALMRELMKVADVAVRESEELDQLAAQAAYALHVAKSVDGAAAIRSAAFATRSDVQIEVGGTTVMGVPIPIIERKTVRRGLLDRGYSLLTTSARVDETADAFENEIDLVIELATIEKRLRRLGDVISSTSRRVNALDNTLIPRLSTEVRYISTVLEEREREDVFRLKRVKRILARSEEKKRSGETKHSEEKKRKEYESRRDVNVGYCGLRKP